MSKQYVFSAATLGKWKQQARALKRASAMTHHRALEHVAQAHGFDNWHKVVTEAKLNDVTETAYRSGIIVAYDIKDATESWVPDDSFVGDSRIYHFCKNDIFAWYRRGDEELEGQEQEAIPTDPTEYREQFDEWLMNVHFFRFTGTDLPPTPTKLLPLLSERCFFGPMFFWFRGKFVDPWRDLAINDVLDMSGNTEPESHKA